MPAKFEPTDEEKKDIVSLYAKGNSINSIANKYNVAGNTIKRYLRQIGYFRTGQIIYTKKCIVCNKKFLTFNSYKKYCGNPCHSGYVEGSDAQTKAFEYQNIKILRCEFWRLIKRNPKEAVELEKQMLKEEGKEFTKKALGEITKSDKFKEYMNIYKKYKGVFGGN